MTPENLYRYMRDVTAKGFYLPVKNDTKRIRIFCPFYDGGGDNRISDWLPSLEEAKKELGEYVGVTRDEFIQYAKSKNWQPLTPFTLPVEPYKVGDKVDILEVAKEWGNYETWDKEKKEMVGGKGFEIGKAINQVDGLYYHVRDENKTNSWIFRHEWLVPSIEQYEDKEKTIDDILQNLSEEDREIIIKELKNRENLFS